MNTQPNDGGPAFPIATEHVQFIADSKGEPTAKIARSLGTYPGMSLRDYFAAHAPSREIENIIPETGKEAGDWLGVEKFNWREHYPMAAAKARMIWADAMLAARGKEDA